MLATDRFKLNTLVNTIKPVKTITTTAARVGADEETDVRQTGNGERIEQADLRPKQADRFRLS